MFCVSATSNPDDVARAILTNPEFSARHPDHRSNAWQLLCESRGMTVRMDRLRQMQRHSNVVQSLAAASL